MGLLGELNAVQHFSPISSSALSHLRVSPHKFACSSTLTRHSKIAATRWSLEEKFDLLASMEKIRIVFQSSSVNMIVLYNFIY